MGRDFIEIAERIGGEVLRECLIHHCSLPPIQMVLGLLPVFYYRSDCLVPPHFVQSWIPWSWELDGSRMRLAFFCFRWCRFVWHVGRPWRSEGPSHEEDSKDLHSCIRIIRSWPTICSCRTLESVRNDHWSWQAWPRVQRGWFFVVVQNIEKQMLKVD